MRKLSTIIAINMIALVLVLSGAFAAEMMMTEKSATIHYATNLIGATVNNLQGETLGKIIDLTIDQNRITFAVLSHGGVLGVGEKLIPVPMSALSIKDEKTVLLDISKDKLATAPNFERSKRPDFSNRQWTEDTYRFYGLQPFWKESGMEHMMGK
ncbi:MAG: PRC-barrel domain-containing protein [Nitrospirae bacterium]|nr:PRC-barrel domain-containing protein [Nitrospirota bacterium]